MKRRRVVRVPASSANLGPGYDVLAAALSLHLELEVEETGEFFVALATFHGVPTDRTNLCVRAFERLHPADGRHVPDPLRDPAGGGPRLERRGDRGRASRAADHMYELDAPLFDLAAELEGHPDNVAAALYGGFVICPGPGEAPVRFDPPPGLEGVLAIPAHEVPTAEARAALPAEVPIEDAVHNVGHAAAARARARQGRLQPDRRAACATACTSRAGARSTRARWSWWTAPRSSARWAPRSRAPARRSCSGATGSRPARSSSG